MLRDNLHGSTGVGRARLAISVLAMTQGYAFAAPVIEQTMNVPSFGGIVVHVPASVSIDQSGGSQVKLSGEPAVLEKIKVEVTKRVLHISAAESFVTQQPLVIHVEVSRLDHLTVASPADVAVNSLVGNGFGLEVSAAADVALNDLQLESLDLSLIGSATVSASGQCARQSVSVRGSGDWHAAELQSKTASVHVDGSGDANVFVTQLLEVRVNGSGTVRYLGSPTLHQTVSDAGTVEPL